MSCYYARALGVIHFSNPTSFCGPEATRIATHALRGQYCLQRSVILEDVGVHVENVPENVEVEALNGWIY